MLDFSVLKTTEKDTLGRRLRLQSLILNSQPLSCARPFSFPVTVHKDFKETDFAAINCT